MATVFRGYVRHSRSILRDRMLCLLPEPGSYPTPVKGFSLHRYNDGETPASVTSVPVLTVVVQGKQQCRASLENPARAPRVCCITAARVPALYRVREATPDKPYLALTMDIDYALMAQLAALSRRRREYAGNTPGAEVQKTDYAMLDAFARLLQLLSQPEQIPFLAPLFRAEIHYRLLVGSSGAFLPDSLYGW